MKPIQIPVLFMAASLLAFFLNPSTQAVCLFTASSVLFGFFSWMDRNRVNDLKELKDRLDALQSKVAVMHSLGMG